MEHPHNIWISHIHSIHCGEVTGSLTHKACLLRLRYRDLLASAVLRAGGETLTLQWRVRRQLVTAGLNAPHQVLSWRRNDMFRLVAGTNPVQLAFPRRDSNLGFQCRPTVLFHKTTRHPSMCWESSFTREAFAFKVCLPRRLFIVHDLYNFSQLYLLQTI